MITDLIQNLFAKAEERTGKPGNRKASCEDLSNWMFENLRDRQGKRVSISVRTLERIYDQFILEKENVLQRSDPSAERLDYFAQYLGYLDYSTFIQQNLTIEETQEAGKQGSEKGVPTDANVESRTITAQNYIENDYSTTYQKIIHSLESNKTKWLMVMAVFTAVAVLFILYLVRNADNKLCLVWEQNHYASKSCDEISSSEVSIAIDEQEWQDKYKTFRKIDIDRNTPLLSEKGQPLVWYHYANDSFEFYNSEGKHPETGEPLKPITFNVAQSYLLEKSAREGVHTNSRERASEFKQDEVGRQQDYSMLKAPISSTDDAGSNEALSRGKYCFLNDRPDELALVLNGLEESRNYKQRLEVRAGEEICPFLPIGKYSYVAKSLKTGGIVKSGTLTIIEHVEGSLRLTALIAEKEEGVAEVPNVNNCKTGDIEVFNQTGRAISVRLSDFGERGVSMATFYKTIYIASEGSGKFYKMEEGNYTLEIIESNIPTDKKYSIHVEPCETTRQNVK